jgi:leucyl aminopeptidase (aminopeptidase T)
MCALGAISISCVTQATDEELSEMCDNLVNLRGEVPNPSVETITSNISVKFDEETKRLAASRSAEEESLKEEMETRLEAAKTDAEKSEIREEYKARLEEVTTAHAPKMAAIRAQKSEVIQNAKNRAEENEALWTEAVNDCISKSKKEGVPQRVARCRIQAQTTDKYWNGCR